LIKIFTTQVDRLTNLIEDLLDVSRIRLGRLSLSCEPCLLSELVRQVIEQLSTALAAAQCRVELKLEEGVVGNYDRKRIQQVVTNLITNATKYAARAPIHVSLTTQAEGVRLSVQDFGPGIPTELQGKVFERYERAVSSRNVSGLGLGLFISREIIEAHGGSIQVASEAGKGSLFTVMLPLLADNYQNQLGSNR
jgi:signal transduction histidine kinase